MAKVRNPIREQTPTLPRRRTGSDARTIDLHLRLAPGEVRTVDLRKSALRDFALAQLNP